MCAWRCPAGRNDDECNGPHSRRGMSGFLFDTNVLLDIATADPIWLPWSEKQFRTAAAQGPVLINPIIYAELAPAFANAADLDRWLNPAVFHRLPLPYAAGWLAAQA